MDSSSTTTNPVRIYKGYKLPHAILPRDLAGQDLNVWRDWGYSFTTSPSKRLCMTSVNSSVTLNFRLETAPAAFFSSLQKNYELGDSQAVSISNTQLQCPEPLFQPSCLGTESCHTVETSTPS